MQGFKSFADKTVLDFDKGITAVVGPNGSGKSNISDAVKWVLGEQSPKTLRGSRMEDVIFSGTESRKPVGMAEVSLIVDNEDRRLNIDFGEVRITRRLYRSGDSEYLINNAQCRMKDIHLLFADTGIGKDGYSLIGQGRVDEILNSKSDDRRNIFEDASGIMKYRMRKQESERKLGLTEQNLMRVNDIVNELERQLKPLEKQAASAKKYLEYKYELRDIEVGVLTETIDRASEKLAAVRSDIEILQNDKRNAELSLEAVKNENAGKTDKASMLSDMISETRNRIFDIEKRTERFKGDIKINEEKIRSAENNKKRIYAEQEEQKNKNGAYALRIDEIAKEAEALSEKMTLLEDEAQRLREDHSRHTAESDDARREAASVSDKTVELKLLAGRAQNKADAGRAQAELISARKLSIDEELSVLESSSEVDTGAIEAAETEKKAAEERLEDSLQLLKNRSEELDTVKKKESMYSDIASSASAELQSAGARLTAIREMENDYEGYAFSVKKVLSLCRSNPEFGRGVCGAVAQLIRVPVKYETAIETALGQAYQNIITETEDDARKAIEYLKKGRYGRATFLPLTSVNVRYFDAETQRTLAGSDGFIGIASELAEYDRKYKKAVDSLLSRVAVFDSLDCALRCASGNRYAFMCVTLDGDILRTSGAITGGSAERGRQSAGTLSRTREIPELEKKMRDSQAACEEARKASESCAKRASELEAEKESLQREIHACELSLSQWSARHTALVEKRRGETERRDKLVAELKEQVNAMLAARRSVEEAEEEGRVLLAELEKADRSLKVSEKRRADAEKALDDANKALMAKTLEEADTKAALNKLRDDVSRYEREIKESDDRMKYYGIQLSDIDRETERINKENSEYAAKVASADSEREEAEKSLSGYESMKSALDAELGGMLGRITEISGQITRLTDNINKAEIRLVREESEINAGKNRLWEEYELTYAAAKELTGGAHIDDYAEASKRIKELRTAIKALGPVNVNAIEEFESTKERFTFMSAQKKDMDESKEKLKRVISDLNSVMRKQFKEQFVLIRENFKTVFRELFGGGKADIVLEEGEDVLECGIEIQAQPPGKKLQNMLLLSGGERALTAIALLFGILKMHPSPFCLLDEIEAALDDANVYRLSDYLSKIEKNIQFIMITHRKGTMENAESLYGVTMEEKGISKVISLKMSK